MKRIGPPRGLLLLFACWIAGCRGGEPASSPSAPAASALPEVDDAPASIEGIQVPPPLTPPPSRTALEVIDPRGVRLCFLHRPELARTRITLELEPAPRPELTTLLQAWLEARSEALASSSLDTELTWSPSTSQLGAALTDLSTGWAKLDVGGFPAARSRALELLRTSEEDPASRPFVHLERLGAATWDRARSPLVGSAYLSALELRAARASLEITGSRHRLLVSSPHDPESLRRALGARPFVPQPPRPLEGDPVEAVPVLWPSDGPSDWARALLAFPPGTPREVGALLAARLTADTASRGVLIEGSHDWPGLRLSGPVELVQRLVDKARAELARPPTKSEIETANGIANLARPDRGACSIARTELDLPRALHLVIHGPEEQVKRAAGEDVIWKIAEPTRLGATRRPRSTSPAPDEPSPL